MQQNMSPEAKFGETVSAVRTSLSLSQREFAAKLTERGMPVDASAVSRIEKGTRSVRLVEAMTIAEVLDVDIERLVANSETPAQQFRKLRRWADFAFHDLEESLPRAIFVLYDAYAHLHKHPELLETLHDETLGTPRSADEYLSWVAGRLERWEVPDDNFTFTPDDIDAEKVVDVIARFTRKYIGTGAGPDSESVGEDPNG
ncbi:helix-turn-helix domain-containing protein [Paenarthrobacter ureafaciens]|uniref:helix-turn-helix domain-containing protein n=1 Tax=Paenarthrobacter ureafaciens TaxID=37931 RepID=UPI00140758B0|nr:helix-turn-helix transcriptional regulator [Paenarthrobacter ureafaciens]MCX8453353.1 helix-turn-helix transcriptional regulator [Paenarthrobacter ureafaciens]MCY0972934.1 helix-turn-helix transcriptional regulator [Paenarthrobacter ureafaciens]